MTKWQEIAKKRWPRSEISGDGPYAILDCAFFHPSAKQMTYSDASLFETPEEAKNLAEAYDQKNGRCHASSKGLCKGTHPVVDLRDAFTDKDK